MNKKLHCIAIALIAVFLIFISANLVIAAEQIRPAPQTESRGVGEQIRPANQMNLPSNGNGNYQPSQGSDYSSGFSSQEGSESVNIARMEAVLNGTNANSSSNATGTGIFTINATASILSYNITINNLESNETSADIALPDITINNQTVSYPLSLGNIKEGVITYLKEVENYFLDGNALVRIRTLLFPEGELSGYIRII